MASLAGIYILVASSVAGGTGETQQLAAEAAHKLLVTDVQKEPHKITLAPALAKPGARYWGLYKICVDAAGKVAAVNVIRGASERDGKPAAPAAKQLDERWMETIKRWQYRPLQIDGQAVPFCYVANLGVDQPLQDTGKEVMLAPNRGLSLRVSDVNQRPHRPMLPPRLNRNGMVLWGLYKICVGTDGNVTTVTTIKPAPDNEVNAQWVGAMQTWRHKPHVVDGTAMPFCYPGRVEVRADSD